MAGGIVKGKHQWSDKKKAEVVTTYLTLGNAPATEAVTGVPAQTIRIWKMQPWWTDMVEQIRIDDAVETDAKLTKIKHKTLAIIEDRLENGEFLYNSKTGELQRVPVKIKDVSKVSVDVQEQSRKTREAPTSVLNKEGVNDRLLKIAEEFAKFVNKKKEKVIDGSFIKESSDSEGEVINAIHEERKTGLQEGRLVGQEPSGTGTSEELEARREAPTGESGSSPST